VSETVNGEQAETISFGFDRVDAGLTVLRFVQLVPNALPAALVRLESNGWYYYELLTVVGGRMTPVRISDNIASGFYGLEAGHGFTCGLTKTGRLVLTQYSFIQSGVSTFANVSQTTYVASSDTAMRTVSSANWVVPIADEASFSYAC
jgi:hypothetical protein